MAIDPAIKQISNDQPRFSVEMYEKVVPWQNFLSYALSKILAGEDVWVYDTSVENFENGDNKALRGHVLGYWVWNLTKLKHEHRGVDGIPFDAALLELTVRDGKYILWWARGDVEMELKLYDDNTPYFP